MKHQDFLHILKEQNHVLHTLTASKGEEYKGEKDDQIGNFRRMSEKTGLRMEQIWQVFFHKHIDAVDTFILDMVHGRNRHRSESIESRINDAVLYLVLLKAILRDQNPGNGHWLHEQSVTEKRREDDIMPRAYPRAVYVAGAELNIALQNEIRHSNLSRQSTVTFISSTDHMHGVPIINTEVLWAGDDNNPMYGEWQSFCQEKGYTFKRWFKG